VSGGGLRLQLFATLAIAVVTTALTAAVITFHLFDRELERALEARLQMLVAEITRAMDAGIAAGLDLDRPQLQERAIRNVRANLAADETIAIVDPTGRIVTSSNPAEIGEIVPLEDFITPDTGPTAGSGERTVAARPIQSLFGAPAGWVTARVGPGVLDEPRRAFIAKTSLATAGTALAGLLAAVVCAAWLPWRARRAARGIERHLASLYAGIGTGTAVPELPDGLPPAMASALDRFTRAVESREHELRSHADAVDVLDEAA